MLSDELGLSSQKSTGGFATNAAAAKAQVQRDAKFVNRDLEEKTNQLQDEFNKILSELNERRINRNGDYFYEALNQYYQEGSEAHSSPVRRLIQ